MDRKFCTSCGAALTEGAAFCVNCGAAVPAPGPSAAPPPVPAEDWVGASVPHTPHTPPAAPPQQTPQYAPATPVAAFAPANEQEAMLAAYLGPNAAHYLTAWRQLDAQGKQTGWNWAAFFFSWLWLAYRKMWVPALVAFAAFAGLQAYFVIGGPLSGLASYLPIGIAIGIGWYGMKLYRDHATRSVALAAATIADPQARMAILSRNGGVSFPAALGLVAIWGVLFAIASTTQEFRRNVLGERRLPPITSTERPTAPAGAPTAPAGGTGSGATGAAVTEQFLLGDWATSCTTPPSTTNYVFGFFGGGRLEVIPGGPGRWSLSGHTLTMIRGSATVVAAVRQVSPTQMGFVFNGEDSILNRCAR